MEKELNDELKQFEITALNEKAENAVAVAAVAAGVTERSPFPLRMLLS